MNEKKLRKKLEGFDPNAPGQKGSGIYGLPFGKEESAIVLFPVPWEVTVSYSGGTARGPEAILNASFQVDLYDEDKPGFWKKGIYMEPVNQKLLKKSDKLRRKAETYISALEEGGDPAKDKSLKKIADEINSECMQMNDWVRRETGMLLDDGKIVGLIGGDHSTPLGFIQALSERHDEFGILHIDAHADLRDAYEGFQYSHASIMFNAIQLEQVKKLVQVGIRDFCEAENDIAKKDKRVEMLSMRKLSRFAFEGKNWQRVCADIVQQLPKKVYVSFDIDGLDPSLCPHTGTPVPDGIGYEQACYLLHALHEGGKQIIGFDLVEVAPGPDGDEWDGNVGARLLFRLCALMGNEI